MFKLLENYWAKTKKDTMFIRKIWSVYLFGVLTIACLFLHHSFRFPVILAIFGTFVLVNVVTRVAAVKLNRRLQDNHILQYFDLLAIFAVLVITHWNFPVTFVLYLFIIMAAFSYGPKKAYIYALVTGTGYSVLYMFLENSRFDLLMIGHILFTFSSMLLTAYMGSILKDRVKEVEKSNEDLNRRNSEMFVLQQIGNYVTSVLNIDDLLQLIPDVLVGISGAKYAAIYLSEDGTFKGLKIKATNCQEEEIVQELFLGVCGYRIRSTFMTGNPTIENYITCGEFGSMMNVPIKHQEELLGVVVLTHYRPNAFDETNLQLLMSVVNQISIAIANARLYEKVRQMANIDGLTGIYNRKYLQDYLANFFACKEREDLTLIMLDIDHFKKVNDNFGHLMGDHVLKTLTDIINRVIPVRGFSARYGGEEFVVILPSINVGEGYKIAEELREQVSATKIVYQDITCQITISLGVAGNNLPCVATMDDLLNAADGALYKAKETRNCTVKVDKELFKKNG